MHFRFTALLAVSLSCALASCTKDSNASSAAPTPPAAAPVIANAQTARFSLGQTACSGCVKTVRGALTGVDGVGEVAIKVGDEDFTVTYDPAKVEPAALVAKLHAAGESKVALK